MTLNEIMEVFEQEVNEKTGVLTSVYYDQPQSGAAWHAVSMARKSRDASG